MFFPTSYWIVVTLLGSYTALSRFAPPGYNAANYTSPGDVLLGVLMPIRNPGPSLDQQCSDSLFFLGPQWVHAVVYAMNKINADDDILPNVQLGIKVMDTCARQETAMTSALQFFPERYLHGNDGVNSYDVTKDVFGIVGDAFSSTSKVTSKLLAQIGLPQVSSWATDDDLSDKSNYPNFLRLVPPNKFQARAIIEILKRFKWSYVSLITSDDAYGLNGLKLVETMARKNAICVRYAKSFSSTLSEDGKEEIVDGLVKDPRAKVVIVFSSDGMTASSIMDDTIARIGNASHYIWIITDALTNNYDSIKPKIVNSLFGIGNNINPSPEFDAYYTSMTGADFRSYPWYEALWQKLFKCSWTVNATTSCHDFVNRTLGSSNSYGSFAESLIMDNVYVFAHAAHDVIATKCPSAFTNVSFLVDCFTKTDIQNALYALNFTGASGNVGFDQFGDGLGKYDVLQWTSSWRSVGTYVRLNEQAFSFMMHDGLVNWTGRSSNRPESLCSKPCADTEITITLELKCCWECRRCRDNEYHSNNHTRCTECPPLYWPDPALLFCKPIPPTYLRWTDALGITLTVFATLGAAATIGTIVVYAMKRGDRLIKASNYIISNLILTAILLSYLLVFVIVAKPHTVTCFIQRLAFNTIYSMLYAPLLAKTIQIYRIFDAGKKGNKRPTGISTPWILAGSVIGILVQVSTERFIWY